MNVLYQQVSATLLPGVVIPEPLRLLFAWIEANGLFIDTERDRIGFLFPQDQLKAECTDTERPGGTDISFLAEGNTNLKYWFGHDKPDVLNRLCVFAQTGGDGSMAAFWLDDGGAQKIVHLGSGSGSTLVCVLAENGVDFSRLLAIGYDEICWRDVFLAPPNTCESDLFIHRNAKYREWVGSTLAVSIPNAASEIVKYPSEMGDRDSLDPFCRWVERNSA
jgi:hypothetical protein